MAAIYQASCRSRIGNDLQLKESVLRFYSERESNPYLPIKNMTYLIKTLNAQFLQRFGFSHVVPRKKSSFSEDLRVIKSLLDCERSIFSL